MAALIDTPYLSQLAALSTVHAANNRLAGAIAASEKTLRQWVSNATVDEAIANLEPTPTPSADDLRQAETLRLACGFLALYYALPLLAVKLRTDGMLRSDATEVSRSLVYLTPKEINDQRKMYWETAKETAKPYMVGGSGGVFAGGISKSDKETRQADSDRVAPVFRRDLFADPGEPPVMEVTQR